VTLAKNIFAGRARPPVAQDGLEKCKQLTLDTELITEDANHAEHEEAMLALDRVVSVPMDGIFEGVGPNLVWYDYWNGH
jgi:hypothetical protein